VGSNDSGSWRLPQQPSDDRPLRSSNDRIWKAIASGDPFECWLRRDRLIQGAEVVERVEWSFSSPSAM
jgi:hypothetical protein